MSLFSYLNAFYNHCNHNKLRKYVYMTKVFKFVRHICSNRYINLSITELAFVEATTYKCII